jgi:spartin
MSTTSEAHILVTIPNATLSSSSSSETLTGQLALEYVTFDLPPTVAAATQDVLLVLVLRTGNVVAFEAPLDPARALTVSSVVQPPGGARRRYVFHATQDDTEFTVELPLEQPNTDHDDVELFHSVLEGYVADLRVDGELHLQSPPARLVEEGAVAAEDDDLRGRFVLMDEGDGEIVGTLDRSVRVREDPSLVEKGRERDPVVVELPEGADTLDDGLLDEEVLVRTIPPEERDWMVKGAVFVWYVFFSSCLSTPSLTLRGFSHAISGTTTLLTSAMATASNLYIARSTPSTSTASNSTTAATPKRSNTPSSSSPPPPAPPSRTLLILQSPTTRKHLDRIHTVSGGAVKLSNKATAAVENLIERAIGSAGSSSANRGKGRAVPFPPPTTASLPPRSRGPSPAPPDTKPALPPRRATPSRGQSPQPHLPLRTRTSLALSAALILGALEASSVRLVEAGGAAVTAAVSHKYGTTAGANAALAASTARNIMLVYVDVRGLRRRVIVRRVGKTWARGHVTRTREEDAAARRK